MNAELLTVWHGARWREFPQPQVGAPVGGVIRPGFTRESLSDRQVQILALLETRGDLTMRDLYRACLVSWKTMRADLGYLLETGHVIAKRVPNVNRGGWGWVYRRRQG
jgi:hypothetical protein